MIKSYFLVISAFSLASLIGCVSTESLTSDETRSKATEKKEAQASDFSVRFSPNEEQVEKAKVNVTSKLKDPESARFEQIYGVRTYALEENGERGEQKRVVICGHVNSKNSYGGYVGKTPFGTNIDSDGALLMVRNPSEADNIMNDVLRSICSYEKEDQ